MTNSRQDYLKVIFELNELKGFANNKNIAMKLGISGASVSEMLKKLSTEGLIENVNSGVTLSKEGLEYSKELVSKHRLWEIFLIKYLGYTWKDVHEQADLLEHVTGKELKERLNKFLNYPKICPHGGFIYDNIKEDKYFKIRLSKLAEHDKARIVRVMDDKGLLDYLDRAGLSIGSEIEILNKDPYDSSLFIRHIKEKFMLSEKVSRNIFVEKL